MGFDRNADNRAASELVRTDAAQAGDENRTYPGFSAGRPRVHGVQPHDSMAESACAARLAVLLVPGHIRDAPLDLGSFFYGRECGHAHGSCPDISGLLRGQPHLIGVTQW